MPRPSKTLSKTCPFQDLVKNLPKQELDHRRAKSGWAAVHPPRGGFNGIGAKMDRKVVLEHLLAPFGRFLEALERFLGALARFWLDLGSVWNELKQCWKDFD